MLEAILNPSWLSRRFRWLRLSIRHPLLHDPLLLITVSHGLCHVIPLLLCPVHNCPNCAPSLFLSVIDLRVRLLLHVLIVPVVTAPVTPWILILINLLVFIPVEDLRLGGHDRRVLLDHSPADRRMLLLVHVIRIACWLLEAVGEEVVS